MTVPCLHRRIDFAAVTFVVTRRPQTAINVLGDLHPLVLVVTWEGEVEVEAALAGGVYDLLVWSIDREEGRLPLLVLVLGAAASACLLASTLFRFATMLQSSSLAGLLPSAAF